jgi:NAD(P)-dependent dehydrogenase (short-subunit alcohol dehydrogenase family)
MRFEGKSVIVTGAGNGIGHEYAAAFAREGASVLIADLDAAAGDAAAKGIVANGGTAVAVATDVADADAVAAMARAAEHEFGGIDILVNNAGLHMGRYNETSTLPVDEWRRILDVNLIGPMVAAREVRASMAARGGGVIVNQSSMASHIPAGGAYGISKLALNGLTNALAAEFAGDHIRVVGIAPGMIGSDAVLERLSDEHKQLALSMQMLGRWGAVGDLVGTVLFLCSPDAGFITAQTLFVDGGAQPQV